MAVTPAKPAPYAPTSAMLDLVDRYRTRGLPIPVTAEVLSRAGISDSLNSRTLYALQSLDLIDDAGQPTPTFEAIRKAPEAELKARMIEWLNGAYADVLQFVDPATADEVAVRDAFRNYNPIGMQPRMVTLFQGLYAAAGIGTAKAAAASAPRAQRTAPPRRQMISKSGSGSRTSSHVTPPPPARSINGVPEPLAGLLTRLPVEGKSWTKESRDKFVTTFGTLLDFCFPIVERIDEPDDEQEGDE